MKTAPDAVFGLWNQA